MVVLLVTSTSYTTYGCDYDMKDLITETGLGNGILTKERMIAHRHQGTLQCLRLVFSMWQVTLVKMVNEAKANNPNWGS
ncbi:hypothetical protein YC2023_086199 [Brassica napus]